MNFRSLLVGYFPGPKDISISKQILHFSLDKTGGLNSAINNPTDALRIECRSEIKSISVSDYELNSKLRFSSLMRVDKDGYLLDIYALRESIDAYTPGITFRKGHVKMEVTFEQRKITYRLPWTMRI